jgi:hypothetical protein
MFPEKLFAYQMACACSFTATLAGLSTERRLVVCVQYSTKVFKDDKWAIHYYAPIQGHGLVARRDLIPYEPDHPRASVWYYALQLGLRYNALKAPTLHRSN